MAASRRSRPVAQGPRSITSSAMLAMKIAKAGWPISGRNTRRSRTSSEGDAREQRQRDAGHERDLHTELRRAEREGPQQQRAEHQHFALREIDDLGGAVDHDEGNRDEAIDQTDQPAIDDDLQELDHAIASTRLMETLVLSWLTVPSWYLTSMVVWQSSAVAVERVDQVAVALVDQFAPKLARTRQLGFVGVEFLWQAWRNGGTRAAGSTSALT